MSRPTLVLAILLLAGCRGATAPGEPADGALVRGLAVVSSGVGCVTLEIDGRRYEPENLPPELAQVGLRLRVQGIVHRQPSICMSGTGLRLTKVERE